MSWSWRGCAVGVLGVVVTGCPTKKASPAAEESAPVAATTSAPAPSASASASAWYSGSWKGTYEARKQTVDVAADAGRLRAWDEDDASVGVGEGELTITIDDAGQVTGVSRGSLGEMRVAGAVAGDSVRLRLLPPAGSRDPAFAGYVVAKRGGEGLQGTLRAASGDSALVRSADIVLKKH